MALPKAVMLMDGIESTDLLTAYVVTALSSGKRS